MRMATRARHPWPMLDKSMTDADLALPYFKIKQKEGVGNEDRF